MTSDDSSFSVINDLITTIIMNSLMIRCVMI